MKQAGKGEGVKGSGWEGVSLAEMGMAAAWLRYIGMPAVGWRESVEFMGMGSGERIKITKENNSPTYW